jgi:four helix bundle protein
MENLIVYQKMTELTEYLYVCIRQFPKSEKHSLAADIKHQAYTVLRLIVQANKRYYKKTTMQDIDIEHEILRKQVEMAMTLKFLPFRQYENATVKINEVGKLIGAWKKSSMFTGPG